MFAKAVGVPKEYVLVTAGSSEVLSVAALAYGLHGGAPGAPGRNSLLRGADVEQLPGHVTLQLRAGDIIRIETPGGGGYGEPGA